MWFFFHLKILTKNGKREKWFDLYKNHRDEFDNFEEFLSWYNSVRPHMSLAWNKLETPEKRSGVGYRDILGNFMEWTEQKKKAENDYQITQSFGVFSISE